MPTEIHNCLFTILEVIEAKDGHSKAAQALSNKILSRIEREAVGDATMEN